MHLPGRIARVRQVVRKRHGDASCVGGSQQFFGIRSGALLETGSEGVGDLLAQHRYLAFALFQIAFPDGFGCTYLHDR